MKILVTGCAGFIGFHLSKKLLQDDNCQVIGLDNLNAYYDINLKHSRLEILKKNPGFTFYKEDLSNKDGVFAIFENEPIDYIINLAAQAGVRYSLENPFAYTESNLTGFLTVLEASRTYSIKHLIYASTSSIYGLNSKMPFSEEDPVDHPVSLYAASKRANELMAHSYSQLFNIPTTGLRFFTVYGPYGRPDMALFKFTKAMLAGEPIDVYNHGEMKRDFTYVDDIVEGISRLIENPPNTSVSVEVPNKSNSPFRILNIGSNNPIMLMDFIKELEFALGLKAKLNFMDMQPGDIKETYADVSDLIQLTGYKPETDISTGIKEFINWYKSYYPIKETSS